MKRLLILMIAIMLCTGSAMAQKATDKQAIELAKECYEKGMSMEQAVMVLQTKGVSVSQMKDLKTQYESGTLNMDGLTDKIDKERTRSSLTRTASADQSFENARMEDSLATGSQYTNNSQQTSTMRNRQDSINSTYGQGIFQNSKLSFAPNMSMATPLSYVLGPGDDLGILIFGSSEVDLSQKISAEGRIYASGVGPISLMGLTIEQARIKLRRDLGKIYGGLTSGGATLNVTLNSIRSIQVNVMGDVSSPGTYMLPSLATVFHALYASGGVTSRGTLRNIKVMRDNQTIGNIDIYKFILSGDKSGDIALQDGDVIFVESYINRVTIPQGVKRAMRYELKDGETIADLLRYAGGFTNEAFRTALNVTRQNDHGPKLFNVRESEYDSFELSDGDKVVIGQRYQKSDNKVVIEGAVYNAGTFAIDDNTKTLKQLIEAADGLREDAFMDRALLQREMADWSLEMESVDLNKLLSGEIADIELRANDEIYIPSKTDMREEYTINISGYVAIPGQYRYATGMTAKDLIVRAGGLLESASLIKVDISRRIKDPKSNEYSPVRSQIITITLGESLQTESGTDLVLEPFDQIYIRKSPSYSTQNTVTLNGEVLFAGSYALDNTGVRVSEVIRKAGGVTPAAFIDGASLERRMTLEEQEKMNEVMYIVSRQASRRDSVDTSVFQQTYRKYNVGFNLKAALDKPGSSADIILQPGDVITVPEYNGTVQIIGSVLYPNAIVYEDGKKLKEYVKGAGGYSQLARKSKVFVLYMNGTATTGRRAKIIPGCQIVVPMKSKEKSSSLSEIMSITSQTASMASIVASMSSLFR